MPPNSITRQICAPRDVVYSALIDPRVITSCMAPEGMTSLVHAFEPIEGGVFRVSLRHGDPGRPEDEPKTVDFLHGFFVRLVPNHEVDEWVEFENEDPSSRCEMRISFKLEDSLSGGTRLVARRDRTLPGVSSSADRTGWKLSLARLAGFVEGAVSRRASTEFN